jgi:hypothetical protein
MIFEESWLYGELGLRSVDPLFVADNGSIESNALLKARAAIAYRTFTYHFPPPAGQWGRTRGKLMLLFRKDGYLRVAVPTANLRRAEWGVLPPTCGQPQSATFATLDNTVFLIDLPLYASDPPTTAQLDVPFRRQLLSYLTDLNMPSDIFERVRRYDFTPCRRFGFVYTGFVHCIA